ncbi:hypothetical protein [Pseudonocardia sp.]|uniref:hypothetical protein n=1 Tax=Pseudonocardia sp. TaxID=60912 RepID=UPI0031FC5A50
MMRSQLRTFVRYGHIALAVAIGAYVYVPPSWPTGLREFLMFAGIPLASLSGAYLWQQGRIHRWIGRKNSSRSAGTAR